MNIPDLMQYARTVDSGGVRIVGMKYTGDPFPIRCLTRSSSGRTHQQTIEGISVPKATVLDTEVLVYCDCPDFKYRCDYSLYREGASRGMACHRVAPRYPHSSPSPSVCKHLARVLIGIYGRYRRST